MPNVLTTREVALTLRVHVNTVMKLLQSGELEGFKVRHRWRVKRETLETFMSEPEVVEGD
jgi:excisionase family DNA binding protein